MDPAAPQNQSPQIPPAAHQPSDAQANGTLPSATNEVISPNPQQTMSGDRAAEKASLDQVRKLGETVEKSAVPAELRARLTERVSRCVRITFLNMRERRAISNGRPVSHGIPKHRIILIL